MTRLSTAEIDWVEPKSSNIAAFGYHHARSILIVDFKDKTGNYTETFEYNDVSPEVFDAMKSAPSVGKYFYANVRGVFKGEQSATYSRDKAISA